MEIPDSRFSEELAKVLLRKRKSFRFTQADLGRRIGVSGSYISGLENGKASPRVAEVEALAAHFRTTAMEIFQAAQTAEERYIPATPPPDANKGAGAGLDAIAEGLSPERRALAREFLLFLRERERVDEETD